MIDIVPVTEEEKAQWPKTVIVPLDLSYPDDRGEIVPLVDLDMKSAVMITSRKGSVRANHYHTTDWHFCYVVSGKIDYYHRPTGSAAKPAKRVGCLAQASARRSLASRASGIAVAAR